MAVVLYFAHIAILARAPPDLASAIPADEVAALRGDVLERVAIALMPALVLIRSQT